MRSVAARMVSRRQEIPEGTAGPDERTTHCQPLRGGKRHRTRGMRGGIGIGKARMEGGATGPTAEGGSEKGGHSLAPEERIGDAGEMDREAVKDGIAGIVVEPAPPKTQMTKIQICNYVGLTVVFTTALCQNHPDQRVHASGLGQSEREQAIARSSSVSARRH